MSDLWIASVLVLWVVVLFGMFLLVGTLRQLGLIQMRLGTDPGALITTGGLDRGSEVPDFSAPDVATGEAIKWSDLGSQRRLLTVLSTGCLSCEQLVPHLNEIAATHGDELDFLTVCVGDAAACASFVSHTGLKQQTVVDRTGAIERSLGVTLTPFTYLVEADGRVLIRGVANNWTQLESLIEQQGTPEGNLVKTAIE